MNESSEPGGHPAVTALDSAAQIWITSGNVHSIERWIDRELDEEGVPRRLAIPVWWDCLRTLAGAKGERGGWPRRLDAKVLALTRSLLRFARPDGTPTLGPDGPATRAAARALLGPISKLYPNSREARLIAWMLGRPEPNHTPPPLPAWNSSDQVLSVLRASWLKNGDVLTVDQRGRTPTACIELIGSGVPWLGPEWRLMQAGETAAPGKPGLWQSNSVADLTEWAYRAAGFRLSRTALVLRGRRMALMSEQVNLGSQASDTLALRFGLAAGVRAEPLDGSRGFRLIAKDRKASAQVLPIGLPALPYETERGWFRSGEDGRSIQLATVPRGKRCWLPLLISWDPARHRKLISWRQLTVSEDGRVCTPDTAFAVRVSWGRDDTVVIYRSLGAPAHRVFLGHQTSARFLVGTFDSEGVVEPLVTIDE
jgi:hypothetical protein